MHWKPTRRGAAARTVAVLAAVATAAGMLFAGPSAGTPKPVPPTPPSHKVTQGQVDAAAGQQNALAAQVGRLSGEIAQAQDLINQKQAEAELAEQKYALAYSQWMTAQANAKRAQQELSDARTAMAAAHTRFVEYVQATYMSGQIDGTAGSLLTAQDPSQLLQQSALDQYQQQQKADAVGAYQAAAVSQSNKEAAARRAENAAQVAKQRADLARQAAHAAFQAAKDQKAALDQVMASKRTELTAATTQLNSLRYGRSQWLSYLNKQQAYDSAMSSWRAEQARLARLKAIRDAQHHRTGGGGGGGYSPPPSGGGWTANKGWAAVHRAMSQLGTPYAWAGGGAYGPSRGVCDPSNGAPNDCYVIGFDCSGLAMYAWGASWWAHFASAQYTQAGSYHPGAGNLAPGDLIFWSLGGSIGGIHHVAIYIGGGQIVEAPYSGGVVQVASLWEYGGFFGATRPGT